MFVFGKKQMCIRDRGGNVYIADFVVLCPDGHYTVEDTKGKRTDTYIMKRKLFREKYGFDIVEK